MKNTLFVLFIASVAFAAEPPKTEAPPVLTAQDREPLHEAQTAIERDQGIIIAGKAAEERMPLDRQALNVALDAIRKKCGDYGVIDGPTISSLKCGNAKAAPPAPEKVK